MGKRPIPVILDTDIGSDIDDTWALALLLRCPELDLRLVTSANRDTTYRAKIIARLLEAAGRTDVPVGVGPPGAMEEKDKAQGGWVADYDMANYPGQVREDGVSAIVETVLASPEPVTVVCIGPLHNVAAALEREPRIAEKARFVGMHGCLAWSHHQNHEVIAEYNVKADVPAAQKVFAALWAKTITPLDTCGRVRLTGGKYRAVEDSPDPLARAVIENYHVWLNSGGRTLRAGNAVAQSSLLYDCVAVYLAFGAELLKMQELGIRVTDDGFTHEDPAGPRIACALGWKNLAAFEDLIVARLTSEPSPPSSKKRNRE